MPDFKRLYLDTTVLRKSNWPHISADLGFLLESARNFGIEVFIPELVELEREAQWLRDFVAAAQRLDAAAGKLAVSLDAVGAEKVALPDRNIEALKAAYRSQSDDAKVRGGIKTVATTNRPVMQFLKLAIDRIPPFQLANDKVTGFQDTAILLSIIDDAKPEGAEVCAIVSEDDVFSKIGHIARQEGISVKHFRSTGDVWKLFVDEISPQVFEWWNRHRDEIRQALNSQSDEIVGLIREKVTPEMVNYRVLKIEAIGTPEVIDLEIPLPDFPNEPGPYVTKEGATFRVSARVGVEFDTLARPGLAAFAAILFQRTRERSVGTSEPPPATKEEPRPETFWKKVQLEANAVYSGGQYGIDDLEFVRIE